MDYGKLERIVELVKSKPAIFRKGTKDTQQKAPLKRITSIREILRSINLPDFNSTIIDIGTGYGYGAVLLNSLGYNVVGIEGNKDKLNEGAQYWESLGLDFEIIPQITDELEKKGRLYFMCRDVRELHDFPSNSIGMATAFYIGAYMLRESAFREVGRVLRNGATFVITTEGPKTVPYFMRGLAVRTAAAFYHINGLRYGGTVELNKPHVLDRFVVTKIK